MTSSILFPAFVNEYSGMEGKALSVFQNNFIQNLSLASEILKLDFIQFDFTENNFLDNEYKSQCISYIFSCSVADILKNNNIKPSYVSGYSMGIYAALYYCGSVTFNDGLRMVKGAWDILSRVTRDGRFGMGMIIGLPESDLQNFIGSGKTVEICNQNNQHTFIISGLKDEVENILNLAKAEGALRANLLPVSRPYHTQYLKKAVPEFKKIINGLSFSSPIYKYVSSLDQQILETAEQIEREVIVNLSNRMNWFATMKLLVTNGIDLIFECGAGDSLTRNLRFLEGEFKSFSIAKLENFLAESKK